MSAFIAPNSEHLFIRSHDEIIEIVKKRMNWYGLSHLVLQSIELVSESKVQAIIVDMTTGRVIRREFATALPLDTNAFAEQNQLAA